MTKEKDSGDVSDLDTPEDSGLYFFVQWGQKKGSRISPLPKIA